jgi:multidrug efflux pump subunit AcrA (membrane-fusion protein)
MKASCFLALALASTVSAGEVTVTAKPFRIERSFSATLLPTKAVPVAVDPLTWNDFEIQEIKPHGAAVKKGEVLVKFDREAIDRKLVDQRRSVEAQTLTLATRELAFAKLDEETKLKLEAAQRTARIAAEDLENFTKVDYKSAQDQAKEGLESAQQHLDGEREELNQLKKMYQADDVVEETEEIVLKRQQFAVKAAELHYHLAELATKHTLEVVLPRQLETFQTADRNAKIALEKASQDLPRGLQAGKLDLDGAKTALDREKADLAKLESDAKLMSFVAPADGIFYYGGMEDGRWVPAEVTKVLVKGGKVLPVKPFATLVTAQPALDLEAAVDEGTARTLTKGLKGNATLNGREDLSFTATVKSAASVPGADGRYRIQIDTEWEGHKPGEFPPDLEVAAGMNMECNFLIRQSDAALVLPVKALRAGPDGSWTVEVKLADGKTEARPVKRGRSSGGVVEITAGIDPGQVVTIPD